MATVSFEKAVEIALEQHRAGHLARAEGLYMEILRQDPGNVDAIHLLGVLAHQGHQPGAAVQLISAAIRKKPDMPVFHYNLAEAYNAMGQTRNAIDSYLKAIDLAPDYFEAQNNLANAYNELKEFALAETPAGRAAEIRPDDAAPFNNLGNALWGQHKYAQAIAAYQKAIALRPTFAEAYRNLGMCLCSDSQMEAGIEKFREGIRQKPTMADLHNSLGSALAHLKRHTEALSSFQTAVELNPKDAKARNNLASALKSLGDLEAAIENFELAVKLDPDFVEAHCNLAGALHDKGANEAALVEVDAALKLQPENPGALFLRAMLLRDLGRFDDAILELRRSLEIQPNQSGALTSLGYALLERGELQEALSLLRHSLEVHPDAQNHSNVLMTINYHPGYTPQDLLEAHQNWAQMHEKPHRAKWTAHTNDRSPSRRLRIGYVSPDFRGHSVSYFLEPILENHNHEQFEIFGYAHVASPDTATWRLRAQIDQWREIPSLSDDKVAEQIRNDQIDILVELAGHTANNSLTVFARKPAPVQINMIGFPSTTGLSAMDYRITDDLCDPPGVTDAFNTESLIRMPGIFWCYLPPHTAQDVGPLPAQGGCVTFTSVNNFTKVTPDVQHMWAKILLAVPKSRLILQTTSLASAYNQDLVRARFAQAGVSPDRLDFRKATGLSDYLKLLERSDMTLDPYPFNGGTTTCHSLWMGAPVITLAGDRHASRMGLSMMTAIGLPEFVAHTPEQYVQIAVEMANDLPRLAAIRAGMRDRLKASPLLDAVGYTRNLESAYRRVWGKWCESAV